MSIATKELRRSPARRLRGAERRKPMVGIIAWIVGLLFVAPVLWMVITSFHSEADAATNPPSFFAPLTLDAYAQFFGGDSGANPWPPLINSAMASVFSTVLVLLLAVPAAYALSIKPIAKWTDVLFFLLSTKMLPIVAAALPLYIFANFSGMLDNIWFLIIMYTSMNLPIAVWMMRSFLAEVPVEMLEAAQLDGAGLVRTLTQVVAPVAMPGIAATSLICFIFSWNEYFLANLLTSTAARTTPPFLGSFVDGRGQFLAVLSAASTLAVLPVVIAGWVAQKRLVRGLAMGAIK